MSPRSRWIRKQAQAKKEVIPDPRTVKELLDNGSWIRRRVISTRIVDIIEEYGSSKDLVVERTYSITINSERLRSMLGEPKNSHAYVPLGMLTKNLLIEFDSIDSSSNSMAILDRSASTRLAFDAFTNAEEISDGDDLELRRIVSSLTPSAVEQDHPLVSIGDAAKLGQLHVLFGLVDLSRDSVVKFKRTELVDAQVVRPPKNDKALSGFKRTTYSFLDYYMLIEFLVPDFGWSGSDHHRIFAPSGTRFSEFMMYPDSGEITYIGELRSDRSTVYKHSVTDELHGVQPMEPPRTVNAIAVLRPNYGGGLWPVPLLSLGVSIILLGMAAWEYLAQQVGFGVAIKSTLHPDPPVGFPKHLFWQSSKNPECADPNSPGGFSCGGPLWNLTGSGGLDAAVTLLFLSLSLMIAYVIRDSENPVRVAMVSHFRNTAVDSLVFPWLACISLLTPRDLAPYWLFWVIWGGLGIISGTITFELFRYVFASRKDARDARRNRGARKLTVSVE